MKPEFLEPQRPAALAFVLGLAFGWTAPVAAQFGPGGAIPEARSLIRVTAPPVEIRPGGVAAATIRLAIEPGWHINANPPFPDYMIPTEVEVEGRSGLSAGRPVYPSPRPIKVGFEDSDLLVYDGDVAVKLQLAASPGAPAGTHTLKGTVRFQACDDQVCLAPASVPFEIAVTVTGEPASQRPAAPDTQARAEARAPPPAEDVGTPPPAPSSGFSTGPPQGAGGPAVDNPLARALDRGSWASFLTLFLIGLALNLTPCVYPMIGVTVSIFGARRAAPPLQVFGLAAIYVLGMAVMYSSLGLVAAFTGGLFGGFLQSPIVLIGIGALLVGLSLSMFGLYELQPPAWLLSKLGGTGATSAAGVFASGLVVGVFAAPCIGPPIVALLALVGAKGDPWFGFSSFFVLSMGLGAPYLVLGTFSNLIQNLPRSGEWMVWVKKVFGVLLLALGAFYALLALAPSWALWVAPVALVLGGLYLGFFEKSAHGRAGFRWLKRLSGAAAAVAGVTIVATTPSEGIAFEAFSPEVVESTLRSGTPVMIDFTASWCAPCHELDRFTFTDRRVKEAARSFRAFKVDLTHYDSPESERWRREFGITGVPTVLFLATDGTEVRPARVEGFLPPERFLQRMSYAARQGLRAAEE